MLPSDSVLTDNQRAIASTKAGALMVQGPAGTGKTTAARARVIEWLAAGIPANQITIFLPQRSLGAPYRALGQQQLLPTGPLLNIITFASLAQRMVGLFWPQIATSAGFPDSVESPIFLSSQEAQIVLAQVLRPIRQKRGIFESVRMTPRRMHVQILDNLNKAALVGFGADEIGARLKAAWVGQDAQRRMFDDTQLAASAFREYCIAHGLVDYSLSVSLFMTLVWPLPACQSLIKREAQYLILDNVEEDVPVAHDLALELVRDAREAVVVLDTEASYRRFLGADEDSAARFAQVCEASIDLTDLDSFTLTPANRALAHAFGRMFAQTLDDPSETIDPLASSQRIGFRYIPQMNSGVADVVQGWVEDEGVPPSEIVIIAPFVSDSLRFSLVHQLAERGVPSTTLRPSRPVGLEPPIRCATILARLTHAEVWPSSPVVSREEWALALSLAIEGLDPVRAALLANLYTPGRGLPTRFSAIVSTPLQQRITFVLGERYDALLTWIASIGQFEPDAPAEFLARLYGDVLAQPGYAWHQDFEAADLMQSLVESAYEFNRMAIAIGDDTLDGGVWARTITLGELGEHPLSRLSDDIPDAVLIAPAYTFLMANRPVRRQVWLNVGSPGWTERLMQPLAHPYVLSRQWPDGQAWTATDDQIVSLQFAYRLTSGLLRRCRETVVMTIVELNEQGAASQGPLLVALQRLLRGQRASSEDGQ